MAGRINTPAKCVFRSTIRFLQADGWLVENDRCSCLLSDFTTKSIMASRVIFIHDNARPHNALVTQQLLKQFKWNVSDHPVYSDE
ncbi:hypothetical protein AVEN_71688-1 [Araneus ventricosus]|uniref:Histone-lysine N-methyltransferase SETMAR n=1 Tax=Araneus ventricosus TaxID=182803 RepID=A0A4Y2FB73_ARAVE|nr:hypothetical protein AVEN_71688-1 [Araneus ventricosus]